MLMLRSRLRLREHFIFVSGIGMAILILSASLAFGWTAKQQMEQQFRVFSANELDSLHALVLSVMSKRRQDRDNVAGAVFDLWFKERNENYPGKLWSVWGPKLADYMAKKGRAQPLKLARDDIDIEAMRTGKAVGRFYGDSYRYSMPIVMGITSGTAQNLCTVCHVKLMGMKKGDVIAVFSSSVTTTAAFHRMVLKMAAILSGMLLAGIGMLIILRMLFGRIVTEPTRKIIGTMESLTKGDLDVSIPFTNCSNEVGDIARAVKIFKKNLNDNRSLFLEVKAANAKLQRTTAELEGALGIADAANRTKSQFLATMSHELRTPLNAIIGFSEIQKDQLFGPIGNEAYRRYAEDIFSSGKHLLHLINDILDFSKSDAGQLTLNEDIVDIAETVGNCTRLVKTEAERANVAVSLACEADLPRLHADARRVRQIVINLLSNAVKFTPSGGKIDVLINRRDGGIAVAIADTGIGIAPEDIPIALQPFGQIDSKLSRKYEGTGLGLPLAKQLVELHGGTLTIESAVGIGTTVAIWFPPERVFVPETNALHQRVCETDFAI